MVALGNGPEQGANGDRHPGADYGCFDSWHIILSET
jgi:hypothetical protein